MTAAPARLANARDVGGLPTTDGGRLRSGVLFRSDAPLLGDVVDGLSPWPPATVVDLRSAGSEEHPLAADGTEVHVIPLIAELDPAAMAELADGITLEWLYQGMLDACGASFARIARLVADSAGPTLVHCAVGKDRTGVTLAVLLDAVGVEREAIVADYLGTGANVSAVLERLATAEAGLHERLAGASPQLLEVPREAIEGVLTWLTEQPGGAAGWLVGNGLAPEELERLRERLVQT